jgi:hypothetical protein
MAGYSGTPLFKKLGIKPGMRVCIVHEPAGYDQTLADLPDGVHLSDKLGDAGTEEMIQFFTVGEEVLEREFAALKEALTFNGTLWIAWPKKASGMATDLNENIVREIGLKNGLVDVKICAIDEVWSGLKFVYRLQDRNPSA